MTRAKPAPGWTDAVLQGLPGRRREADEFQRLLEGGRSDDAHLRELAGVAAGLRSVPLPRPSSTFRTALRERLVAEAAASPVPAPRPAPEAGAPTPRERRPARLCSAVATVALSAVTIAGGTAAASSRALPGDPLYGLKRGIEAMQLALAFSDVAEGRELLEQADARLSEAERLAASETARSTETRVRVEQALTDWAVAAEAGADELTTAYRETGDEEPLLILGRFADDQQERLQDLLVLLDPSLRDQVRAALEMLRQLDHEVTAVLGFSPAADSASGGDATAGDGLAVGELGGPSGSASAAGDPAVDSLLGSTGGVGGSAGPALPSDSTGVGGVGGVTGGAGSIGDAVDGATSGGTSGSGSGSGGTLPDVLEPGTSSGPLPSLGPLPTTSPLPSLEPTPLPTPSPTPTLPSLDPTTLTSPLPSVSVSVSACVPLVSC